MTDKNDKHISEQIVNSFNNNNDENFIRDHLKKFEQAIRKVNEQKQLTSLEHNVFLEGDGKILADSLTSQEKVNLSVSPYKYPDFLEEQSPQSLKRQFLQTSLYNFLDPSNSDE